MSFEHRIAEQFMRLSVKGDDVASHLHPALIEVVRHLARIAAEADYNAFFANGMVTYVDCEEVPGD